MIPTPHLISPCIIRIEHDVNKRDQPNTKYCYFIHCIHCIHSCALFDLAWPCSEKQKKRSANKKQTIRLKANSILCFLFDLVPKLVILVASCSILVWRKRNKVYTSYLLRKLLESVRQRSNKDCHFYSFFTHHYDLLDYDLDATL